MKSLMHSPAARTLSWLLLLMLLCGCPPSDWQTNRPMPVAQPQTAPATIAVPPYMVSDGRRVSRAEAAAWLRSEAYAGRPAIVRGEGTLVYVTPPKSPDTHFLVSVSTPNGIQSDAARALPVWIGEIFGSGAVISDAQKLTGSIGTMARVSPAR